MYGPKEHKQEIHQAINGKVKRDEVIDPAMITASVVHNHIPGGNYTDDFATYCSYRHTRDIVGKELNKVRDGDDNPKQENLFPLLQTRYMVERDGRDKNVPRDQMTTLERRRKAAELRSEAREKLEHADQLDRETDALIAKGFLEPDEIAV